MVNAFAEELKVRGNEAFAAKRFEDAIVLYDKAIETDETNYVYFNNRAAAYHELKNYTKAIEDARKSISIENNAKAHARLGAALWAQGKLREAKGEFEVAAALDPSNKAHKESMQTLEQLINPLPTSSGFAHRRGVPHPYEYARAAAAANALSRPTGANSSRWIAVRSGWCWTWLCCWRWPSSFSPPSSCRRGRSSCGCTFFSRRWCSKPW